jgi:hypothetical protein
MNPVFVSFILCIIVLVPILFISAQIFIIPFGLLILGLACFCSFEFEVLDGIVCRCLLSSLGLWYSLTLVSVLMFYLDDLYW